MCNEIIYVPNKDILDQVAPMPLLQVVLKCSYVAHTLVMNWHFYVKCEARLLIGDYSHIRIFTEHKKKKEKKSNKNVQICHFNMQHFK